MKKQVEVVGAVLVDGQTVLAARRSEQMSLPGMWEFPGGKIEPGETPEEALARELVEELQCTAEIGEHVETTVYEYERITVSLATYYCTLREGTPRLTEHSEIRWVPAVELRELNWAPADIPAVERVIQDLQA
ncbi:(deoxy)nucleoside triphosphate pyrophosphohydrolase [Kocuria palustris]|uniref:(deoxy)nucleoside triphosphate pyrophosphohydrolase n=1 Tax=Kocuria palustris TaxID=71999 RepID=UPI0021A42A08|nr:(deoxy)nucleoside triphosphate pyrophosphohydrolase [Kocuria palustris]MCT1591121.1 (deoxy)nucleoside triphosphate pyrophosphohydrolase [Kocuria palustris]